MLFLLVIFILTWKKAHSPRSSNEGVAGHEVRLDCWGCCGGGGAQCAGQKVEVLETDFLDFFGLFVEYVAPKICNS